MVEGNRPAAPREDPFARRDAMAAGAYRAADTASAVEELRRRRDNAVGGGANCIPFSDPHLRASVPGVEQEQYVVVTAGTKTGKTQLMSKLYLYDVLEWCMANPGRCTCHVLYFPLEESVQRIMHRYMSHLLWKLDGLHVSPAELRSTSPDRPVRKEVLDLLSTERYAVRLRAFDECVEFHTAEATPAAIASACERYALSVGRVEGGAVPRYVPDDPNHFKLMVVDHLALVDTERGMTLKQSMDRLSELCVKRLRNLYGFTCVMVQQQAFENEGLEAVKAKSVMPTLAGLGDSKYSARDSNVVLGLFNPNKFGIPNWLGYDITKLGNHARFVKVLAARDGEADMSFGYLFDGAVCEFEGLPRPDDADAMAKAYLEAERRRRLCRGDPSALQTGGSL